MEMIQKGSRGTSVIMLQKMLGVYADGIFGTLTEEAVKEFQRENMLAVDGIVGRNTWEALERKENEKSAGRIKKKEMIVLLDNGHGVNTPGKRSPDGRLREYAWTREIASRVEKELRAKGIDARRIVTEETDIRLSERCRRVNEVCAKHGARNVVLVSIHNNAAKDGSVWCNARGFSPWVYTKAGEGARRLALIFQTLAEVAGLKGNRAVPPRKYWEDNFSILKNTSCPAVLTECLFQDNKEDVELLMSVQGKDALTRLHVEAISKYIGIK